MNLEHGDHSDTDITSSGGEKRTDFESKNEKVEAVTSSASLDPENWSAYGVLAHNMLDQSISFIRGIRETPIYNILTMPQHVCNLINEPLPEMPQGFEKVCADFTALVLPYATGNIHPRFWGWAAGNGHVGANIAQLMAATMNSNAIGGAQSSTLVEKQVLEWCRQIFGFPESFGGLIVNGTSMAAIVALCIARNQVLGNTRNVRLEGIIGGPKLVGYASSETHFSASKAFELLGLGRNALRFVSVDTNYCIDITHLEKMISEDLENGNLPFCIIGNAGTVNTGSIDDLSALKAIALKYKLWFHVDGAFGALGVLDKELKPRLLGIESADSLAFDFHKWFHVPFDAACLLTRNKMVHLASFSCDESYLTIHEDSADEYPFYYKLGPDLSRGFRALSVWFTLKEHGIRRLGQKVHENCQQIKYLISLLSNYPWIEIKMPAILNIACFRIHPENWVDENKIDLLNENIVNDIQQSGIALPSTTILNGRLYIRCCIINHRTVFSDCDLFVNELVRITQQHLCQ
ncbi:unnamed protein product [Rotaria socialis]|uniref:Uncharacterized protein n=1 Tax=Rotaria socialis TaxID=392032 RepID=A0A819BAT6_9BILA|nr:unnamed protein product [Rotaria socialis]CAF4864088.1 unnamed protein product [Rotaria socialis]